MAQPPEELPLRSSQLTHAPCSNLSCARSLILVRLDFRLLCERSEREISKLSNIRANLAFTHSTLHATDDARRVSREHRDVVTSSNEPISLANEIEKVLVNSGSDFT